MRLRLRTSFLALLIAFAAVGSPTDGALAQAPGYAEILAPEAGTALQGVITISGSANHPAMVSYDLSFGYADNPTGTWFPILEGSTAPVVRDRLALWDTTTLTDGVYDLRLQVLLQDGTVLEAIAAGLRIRNYSPVETPTLAPIPLGPSPVPTASPALALPDRATDIPPAVSPGAVVFQSWLTGAGVALVLLVVLAGYAQARARRRRASSGPPASPPRRRRPRPKDAA
jgi:hypothetical protein